MECIDLHCHSTASDGTRTPAEIVREAVRLDLKALSITDHDTLDGLDEAREEAKRLGLEFIAGVELSLGRQADRLHLLGYLFDADNARFREAVDRLKHRRHRRNRHMLERLRALGVVIDEDRIEKVTGKQGVAAGIGRPHIARTLQAEGVVESVPEAFERFIGEGAPAYVPKELMSPAEGIRIIHDAGGVAVLAHPRFCGAEGPAELAELVSRLAALGLDGLECHYSDHSDGETAQYLGLARRFGLCVTGGSDFHGEVKPDIRLGVGRGNLRVGRHLLQGLKDAKKRRFG